MLYQYKTAPILKRKIIHEESFSLAVGNTDWISKTMDGQSAAAGFLIYSTDNEVYTLTPTVALVNVNLNFSYQTKTAANLSFSGDGLKIYEFIFYSFGNIGGVGNTGVDPTGAGLSPSPFSPTPVLNYTCDSATTFFPKDFAILVKFTVPPTQKSLIIQSFSFV